MTQSSRVYFDWKLKGTLTSWRGSNGKSLGQVVTFVEGVVRKEEGREKEGEKKERLDTGSLAWDPTP